MEVGAGGEPRQRTAGSRRPHHLTARDPMTAPSMSRAAASRSAWPVKRTKPKPRDLPVAPSTMTLADRTVVYFF